MSRLILDGYNVLLRTGRGAGEEDRQALARQAASYRSDRGIDVVIVFDSRARAHASASTSANAPPGTRSSAQSHTARRKSGTGSALRAGTSHKGAATTTKDGPAHPGVRVEFARGDADSAILELVKRSRAPGDLRVVTSDRRLAAAVRDLGGRTLDVAEFLAGTAAQRRRKSATRPTLAHAPALPRTEVEKWMRVFAERKPPEDELD